MSALAVRVLVAVDAERDGSLCGSAALLVSEGVANREVVRLLVFHVEAVALDVRAKAGRDVRHVVRAGGGTLRAICVERLFRRRGRRLEGARNGRDGTQSCRRTERLRGGFTADDD
jgi:hypothetical protein